MATILVQRGKLQRGNNIVAGNAFAKVKALFNTISQLDLVLIEKDSDWRII